MRYFLTFVSWHHQNSEVAPMMMMDRRGTGCNIFDGIKNGSIAEFIDDGY